MLNLNKNQIIFFIFFVLFFLTKTCREYFDDNNCNNIRDNHQDECQIMTETECQEWANNMDKNYLPNNDVFCGVVDKCPKGCYVYNGKVHYGSSTNTGECNNQRICVQKNK